jgi:drug/metabolite transporter (DMT)-like permease
VKLFELVVLASVPLVIAVGQILFKLVSVSAPEINGMEGVLALFYDLRLWIAIALYGGATIAWIPAIRGIPIGQAYLFMALSYVYLPLISWLALGERLSVRQFGGISLIIVGLYVSIDSSV